MKIIIDKPIVQKFPDTTIGYMVAKLDVKPSLPYVENLKIKLPGLLAQRGITKQNLASNHYISEWRKTYKTFGVKPKQYKSSVEALTRRVISGRSVWSISSVVDLYNCCSVLSSFPMGGYDISKVHGDIQLRFGNQGETFVPLGASENESETVKTEHVIYSDNDRVICWLWNYKDSQSTCIDESTKYAVFFVDSAFETTDSCSVTDAINLMNEHLPMIGCAPIQFGVLNKDNLVAELPELDELSRMSIELPEIQDVKEDDADLLSSQKKMVAASSAQTKNPRVERPKLTFPSVKPRLQSMQQLAEPQQFLHWCAIGEDAKLRKIVAIRPELTQYHDSLGSYGIHHAAVGRHLSTVQMLVEEFNVPLDLENQLGYTALMLAIRDGDYNLVSKLLSYGAQVQIGKTSEGETAIDLAHQKGDQAIIQILEKSMQTTATVKPRQFASSLFGAESKEDNLFELVRVGDVIQLQAMNKAGISLDVNKSDGSTLLIEAVKANQKETVKFLLSLDEIDINAVDMKKYSAYMWACRSSNLEMANLIREAGAAVNVEDSMSLSFTMAGGGTNF